MTIVLPVFNGGSFLENAVQSIVDQTFVDWELLVIDDGSTDGAVEALPQLADARIRVLNDGKNKGLSVRLNEGVQQAHGRYFARMDHDDICHPDRFAEQVAYLEAHEELDLLAAYCVTINEQNEIIGCLPLSGSSHKEICAKPWLGFYMPHPTWCGKLEWFKKNNYKQNPSPYCCEDQELLLRAYVDSCFHILPEYLLAYRIRSRTPMKRLWSNRWAWCREQVFLLRKRKSYVYVVFAVLATIARICGDVFRLIKYFMGVPVSRYGTIEPELRAYWESRICAISGSRPDKK
ncbi:glycosyltransferase family 2 protein [Thalassospira marina]|uniref:glycosyltransferase family 2 protein n=1 Tax=Thalassospira marina TaxID=2048283 RepID=UPI001562B0CD|nr:glycosyltransferase family 2 protein [Thalassospira marina]